MELSSREGSRNSSNSRNNLCHATLSDSNIRNNAENFKSLSKRRKYAMRSNDGNSQDRCCSPRSIQAEANIHPYTHCFNNKYIHEIRSVEYEDNKGISHEIKYRAVAQREPFSSTKHKIANNYLSYNSRDSETYKSNSGCISDYNSRSSSKNRRYFSFKEGGMVQSLSPKSNFYNSAPKFYQPENTLTRGFETADNKNIQKRCYPNDYYYTKEDLVKDLRNVRMFGPKIEYEKENPNDIHLYNKRCTSKTAENTFYKGSCKNSDFSKTQIEGSSKSEVKLGSQFSKPRYSAIAKAHEFDSSLNKTPSDSLIQNLIMKITNALLKSKEGK